MAFAAEGSCTRRAGVLLDGGLEQGFICTFHLGYLIAAFEENKGRHSGDLVQCSNVFGLVNITFQEVSIGVLFRKLLESRRYSMARATPCCMEVNDCKLLRGLG